MTAGILNSISVPTLGSLLTSNFSTKVHGTFAHALQVLIPRPLGSDQLIGIDAYAVIPNSQTKQLIDKCNFSLDQLAPKLQF